jgi:hypothetical protein
VKLEIAEGLLTEAGGGSVVKLKIAKGLLTAAESGLLGQETFVHQWPGGLRLSAVGRPSPSVEDKVT